jgi:hypothetical protein
LLGGEYGVVTAPVCACAFGGLLFGTCAFGGLLIGTYAFGGLLLGTYAWCLPLGGAIGASSGILAVGATRGSAPCLAPQPPQNRESGVFSVPQVGQRIPPSA